MDIKKDEGLYFTNDKIWCAIFRPKEKEFLFLEGTFHIADIFTENLSVENAFTQWMRVSQPSSGLKRTGKFSSIIELKNAIEALEKNIAKNEPNFLEKLRKA